MMRRIILGAILLALSVTVPTDPSAAAKTKQILMKPGQLCGDVHVPKCPKVGELVISVGDLIKSVTALTKVGIHSAPSEEPDTVELWIFTFPTRTVLHTSVGGNIFGVVIILFLLFFVKKGRR